MTPDEIPANLKRILDERAGKEHSTEGPVMAALAEILTADRVRPFPYRHHLLSLIDAWASGDPHRFHSVALQMAASIARGGDSETAKRVRDIVDRSHRSRSYLPKYSGAKDAFCAKCESARVFIKYMSENGIEFLERSCGQCGYTWYERCADVT